MPFPYGPALHPPIQNGIAGDGRPSHKKWPVKNKPSHNKREWTKTELDMYIRFLKRTKREKWSIKTSSVHFYEEVYRSDTKDTQTREEFFEQFGFQLRPVSAFRDKTRHMLKLNQIKFEEQPVEQPVEQPEEQPDEQPVEQPEELPVEQEPVVVVVAEIEAVAANTPPSLQVPQGHWIPNELHFVSSPSPQHPHTPIPPSCRLESPIPSTSQGQLPKDPGYIDQWLNDQLDFISDPSPQHPHTPIPPSCRLESPIPSTFQMPNPISPVSSSNPSPSPTSQPINSSKSSDESSAGDSVSSIEHPFQDID